jgi:hypothetical protein
VEFFLLTKIAMARRLWRRDFQILSYSSPPLAVLSSIQNIWFAFGLSAWAGVCASPRHRRLESELSDCSSRADEERIEDYASAYLRRGK